MRNVRYCAIWSMLLGFRWRPSISELPTQNASQTYCCRINIPCIASSSWFNTVSPFRCRDGLPRGVGVCSGESRWCVKQPSTGSTWVRRAHAGGDMEEVGAFTNTPPLSWAWQSIATRRGRRGLWMLWIRWRSRRPTTGRAAAMRKAISLRGRISIGW